MIKEFKESFFKSLEQKTNWGKNELTNILNSSYMDTISNCKEKYNSKDISYIEILFKNLTNIVKEKNSWGKNEIKNIFYEESIDILDKYV